MLKDLTLYGLLAAVITVFAPLWLLIVPVGASISTVIRYARNGGAR